MKKTSTYIASFIISILLVFSTMASIMCLVGKTYATSERMLSLTEQKNIVSIVQSELEKYFTDKSHTTEIPAEIYTDALTDGYIEGIVESKVNCGFAELSHTHIVEQDEPYKANPAMEEALDTFFNDYAKKTGYQKDEKFEKKLDSAKKSAYSIINEYCDVYKFNALAKHGVLRKVAPIYNRLPMLTGCALAAMAVLVLILFIVNIKSKSGFIYWAGTSSLVAGILGTIPCAYLLLTDYFSAFTIKQAQIFTAYTSIMTAVTRDFMLISIVAAGIGIVFLAIYGFLFKNKAQSSKS